MSPTQAEVAHLIDLALSSLTGPKGDAFLFGFSVSALEHIAPGLLQGELTDQKVNFGELQQIYKSRSLVDLCQSADSVTGVRRDLLDSIFQAIHGVGDIDDVAEQVAWIRVALEREGYSSPDISAIFVDSLTRGLSQSVQ